MNSVTLCARQLTAFTRLGALRHLDFELGRHCQVARGHPEAAGRNLLDLAVR